MELRRHDRRGRPLLVGRLYDRAFRPAAGHFFTAAFWLGCAITCQRASPER